jgi:hypothetical protein
MVEKSKEESVTETLPEGRNLRRKHLLRSENLNDYPSLRELIEESFDKKVEVLLLE